VLILTGGPGTGKTTTLRAIVAFLKHLGHSVLLAAPTGRAAQRMAEVIGLEASTVHRMLGFDPKTGRFARNEKHPLEAGVVIIDEASMLDITVAAHLMNAVQARTRLVLVGDVDQLPSVGPGDVLRDFIASKKLPVVQLTKVFRQAEQSLIIRNAHQINRGSIPQLVRPGEKAVDCPFVEREAPEDVARTIVALASTVLPRKLGMDPTADIVVLAPMNRGACGVIGLNQALQAAINPPGPHKLEVHRDRLFRAGDRVLVTRNEYTKDIFNGDLGTIETIDFGNEVVTARFPSKVVRYDFEELAYLTHGYALSVHKSQGSEFPCVIIAIHHSHYVMLSRQILYTALTRAKRFCVLVGSRKAVAIATREASASKRFSHLSSILTDISLLGADSQHDSQADAPQLFDTVQL
jgi:exodeoxyribonuclease V alpha subunit